MSTVKRWPLNYVEGKNRFPTESAITHGEPIMTRIRSKIDSRTNYPNKGIGELINIYVDKSGRGCRALLGLPELFEHHVDVHPSANPGITQGLYVRGSYL